METLRLNSDGKVVIPGLGNGKKQLTIKQIKDAITHIPDTYSIDVDIESKQGLLPPERVTQKGEYPYQYTVDLGYTNTMLGVPIGCNGFIPDYIDSQNLTVGDRVYVIDPKHDDTSKYVLDENKQWIYVGDYNDPEVGGVEGINYAPVVSHLGGMWVVRQNAETSSGIPIVFDMYKKTNMYFGKWIVIKQSLVNEGDICFGAFSDGKLWALKKQDGTITEVYLQSLSDIGITESIPIADTKGSMEGAWVWSISEQQQGNAPIWVTHESNLDDIDLLEQTIYYPTETETYKSNIIINGLNHPMFLKDLVFSSSIGTSDRIRINTKTSSYEVMYAKNTLRRSIGLPGSNGGTITGYLYSSFIPEGGACWFDRRAKTPLVIRFK